MDFLAFVCSRLGKKTGSYDKVDHQSLGCNDLAFHNTSRFWCICVLFEAAQARLQQWYAGDAWCLEVQRKFVFWAAPKLVNPDCMHVMCMFSVCFYMLNYHAWYQYFKTLTQLLQERRWRKRFSRQDLLKRSLLRWNKFGPKVWRMRTLKSQWRS